MEDEDSGDSYSGRLFLGTIVKEFSVTHHAVCETINHNKSQVNRNVNTRSLKLRGLYDALQIK